MRDDPTLIVYEPQRQARLGWRVWGEMVCELVAARELLWRLIWRDVVARYKQSIFGVAWGVAGPLAVMGVFALLRSNEFLPLAGDERVPYALFVYLGLLPWLMLTTALTRATSSLVQAANLVGKVQFPRETLVLAAVGQAVFDLLLGLPFFAVLMLYFGVAASWTVVLVPLVLLVEMMLLAGLGFFLALLNAAMRDVANALPLILVLWMFLTPVVYGPAQQGTRTLMNWLNPAAPLVTAMRDLTLSGRLSQPGPLAVATVVSVVLCLGGWRMFHRLEPRIAERV